MDVVVLHGREIGWAASAANQATGDCQTPDNKKGATGAPKCQTSDKRSANVNVTLVGVLAQRLAVVRGAPVELEQVLNGVTLEA